MQPLAADPSFFIYSATMIILSLNILGLWGYSGVVRTKTKVTLNAEDATTVAKGAGVAEVDPPEIARVLRAHRNAVDNILPFALLAFLYVVYGASPAALGTLCGVFTLARLGHSWAYLGAKQPWRTIFFALGGVATMVMIGFLVYAMVVGAHPFSLSSIPSGER
jgi:uncharacterized membrane protein YecN with MAPEG domain